MGRHAELMAELLMLERGKNVTGRVLTKLVSHVLTKLDSNSDKSGRVLKQIQETGLGKQSITEFMILYAIVL